MLVEPEMFKLISVGCPSPCWNRTTPIGVAPVEDVTVVVIKTTSSTLAGFGEAVSVVDVDAAFTSCLTATEVLAVYLELPTYVAIKTFVRAGSSDTSNSALPEASRSTSPICKDPLRNRTAPFGMVPLAVFTVARRETVCPKVEGFRELLKAISVEACAKAPVEQAKRNASRRPGNRNELLAFMRIPRW